MLLNYNIIASQIGATNRQVFSKTASQVMDDGRVFADYTPNGFVLCSVQHSSGTTESSKQIGDDSHVQLEQNERVLYVDRILKTTQNNDYPDRVAVGATLYECQEMINEYIELGGFASYRVVEVQNA